VTRSDSSPVSAVTTCSPGASREKVCACAAIALAEDLAQNLLDQRGVFAPHVSQLLQGLGVEHDVGGLIEQLVSSLLFAFGHFVIDPSRRRLWGAAVGWPLLVSSLLFAFGHFIIDLAPVRLGVSFAALVFGWMRNRSGSIAPAALFHARCNLLSETLHDSAF